MASDWIPPQPQRSTARRRRTLERRAAAGWNRRSRPRSTASRAAREPSGHRLPAGVCRCRARATRSRRRSASIQVVIVCGETGSGKTTQLPKICLELRARHARPDRPHAAAAHRARAASPRASRRSSARRSAPSVGYKVRFTDRTRPDALHQADDRRHPARRDAARPRCSPPTTRSSSTRRTSAASTSISCSGYLKQLVAAAAAISR